MQQAFAYESPTFGPKDAPVQIVEFTDFECPYCALAALNALDLVRKTYGNQVRFVFKHSPLPFHRRAKSAHVAALCANEQNHFWEYRMRLFRNQKELNRGAYLEHAKTLGLDLVKFEGCLNQNQYDSVIDADIAEAMKLGVEGTPAFLINGQILEGAQPFEEFREVIDRELVNQ